MKKNIIMLFILTTLPLFAEDRLKSYTETVHPHLDDVEIIYENDSYRYRSLIYRGGYEHISAQLFIQKFSVNHTGKDMPYELLSTLSIDEVNSFYNFSIESVRKSEEGVIIVLDAVHTYLLEDTKIKILLSEEMEYEILSGLL